MQRLNKMIGTHHVWPMASERRHLNTFDDTWTREAIHLAKHKNTHARMRPATHFEKHKLITKAAAKGMTCLAPIMCGDGFWRRLLTLLMKCETEKRETSGTPKTQPWMIQEARFEKHKNNASMKCLAPIMCDRSLLKSYPDHFWWSAHPTSEKPREKNKQPKTHPDESSKILWEKTTTKHNLTYLNLTQPILT